MRGEVIVIARRIPPWIQPEEQTPETGEIVSCHRYDNLLVKAGRQAIVDRIIGIAGATLAVFNVIAVGIGTAIPNESDTIISGELESNGRVTTSANYRSDIEAHLRAFFNTGQGNPPSGNLTRAGIFSVASPPGAKDTGTLLAHNIINEAKNSTLTLTFDWKVIIGRKAGET